MPECDRITIDPNVMAGQACIRGMRIPVSLVVNLLAHGKSVAEIIDEYPSLEERDVTQSLKYAAHLVRERQSSNAMESEHMSDEQNTTEQDDLPISADLLEILRCPLAVQWKDKGDDPGQLELVHNCWLVCEDSGLKYPIVDGIPVMLIEEGEKWKDTAVEDLPVPPPDPQENA